MKAEARDRTVRYLIHQAHLVKKEIDDVREAVAGTQYDFLDSRMYEASKHLDDAITAMGVCVGYRSVYRVEE